MSRQTLAMLLALVAAAPAIAAPDPQIYRLSPADRDAAIAAASQRTDTDSPALLPDPNRDRILGSSLYASDTPRKPEVHGEVGAFIGTGGARGIYGTIGTQIGENIFAQFSFEQSRLPGYQYRPYRWQQQIR